MSEGFKEYVHNEQEIRISKLLQDLFEIHHKHMTEAERDYITGVLYEQSTDTFAKFRHLKQYIEHEIMNPSQASKDFINSFITKIQNDGTIRIDLGAMTNLLKSIT